MQKLLVALLLIACYTACSPEDSGTEAPLFTAVPSGIDFVNALPENDSVNILVFEYLYNGGGVGVGDFDGNGLPDLVFSGNMVSSRLYLQTAPWEFRDVTGPAGLTTDVWCSGVNVSDVNGDGREDIYFTTLNPSGANDVPNRLYLNQGLTDSIPVFTEAAAAYGLDDRGYGTHSAWFDYENDGDLDLYVLNNAIEDFNRDVARGTDTKGRGKSVDRIYRRYPDPDATADDPRRSFFRPDTVQTEGWGLGIAVQDINLDGYADIYVANDFLSNDFLLINQEGQGFRDEIRQRIPHQSRNAMGVDVADLTGDGRPEIMIVDMLPDDNVRRKTMFSDVPHQGAAMEIRRGYQQQYVRNTLQLNDGNGNFSDVAFQAGVAATDWSWTPLLMDVDNDGRRDLFVSNGYPKDITNKDFVDFSENASSFGTTESKLATVITALRDVEGVHQPNYFFRNAGDLRFEPTNWLDDTPTYSNGAVLVDLDGDGDLDLVTNNINEPAGVFRNHLRERDTTVSNYFQLDLTGPAGNPDALGTKVWLEVDGQTMYHDHYRQRGYLSTVDQTIHFGLGAAARVDRLTVRFPDGSGRVLTDLPANQRLPLAYEAGLPPVSAPAAAPPLPLYEAVPTAIEHQESPWSDFDFSTLAVRDLSRSGPALAALDLNGDGTDELVFGNSGRGPVTIYSVLTTAENPARTQVQTLDESKAGEAVALLVYDYDGDGDDDLYVGNGSTEFVGQPGALRDLLYRNDNGRLVLTTGVLPDLDLVTSAVATIGDTKDLLVTSRTLPGAYPIAGKSQILRYRNGRYEPDAGPTAYLGLVTAAATLDDGVVIAGDYGSVRYLHDGETTELAPPGWYYSLTPCDLDGDGDLDLLAGNAGLNTPYTASPDRPLTLYVDDFDGNGRVDPILTAYNGDRAYPVPPRNTLGKQIPAWKRQLTTYRAYGDWTTDNLPALSERGFQLTATELRSLYLENLGDGTFRTHPLPAAAQTAPLQDAAPITLPGGRPALLCVQNDFAWEPLGGKLDAGTGFLLTLDANGRPEVNTGAIYLPQDCRSVVAIATPSDPQHYVGVNDGPVRYLVYR